MSAIKLSTPSSGSISLSPADTASNLTITVPASTATMAIDGPAFSAYASAAQTVTNGTFTKVTFGTEQFDTNSNFDSSRFTPTVAGYYQVSYTLFGGGSANIVRSIGIIYKNGAPLGRDFDLTISATANPFILTGGKLVYMNGTTDYLEIYCLLSGSGTMTTGGNDDNTNYFSACLARSA
jgi:hypothetical protein